MEERESDILILEPEEAFEDELVSNAETTYENNVQPSKNVFDENKKSEEKNKTVQKEIKTFSNYNFNNLNKVYKKYNVVETYVPQKKEKPKQNKQFEKFVNEQHDYEPERETVVVEKVEQKPLASPKPKAKAWFVSIIIIFAMLGGLSIYNAVHIHNLNTQIEQTTTSINNINNVHLTTRSHNFKYVLNSSIKLGDSPPSILFSSVQLLSRVRLFTTLYS